MKLNGIEANLRDQLRNVILIRLVFVQLEKGLANLFIGDLVS